MEPQGRPRVFVLRPNTTNIGNELIALGLDAMLRATWPGAVDIVSLPSAGPPRGVKRAGLTAGNVYEANQLADAVLAGGGNVFENGALDVDVNALQALQPPLAVVAASSGRVFGRDGALHRRTDAVAPEHVRRVCALADPILVRDDATAALLGEVGVDDAVVAGCPSLFLDRYTRLPEADQELCGTVLLSVRNPRLMSIPYAMQGRVQRDVARLIAVLEEEFDHVALLCHDYQDLAFASAFDGVAVRYTEDPGQLLSWLRGCALSVGYRLHGFLASVAAGNPALHVSYDERGRSMIETLGLTAYDLPLGETPDVGAAVIERVHALGLRAPRVDAQDALERLHDSLVAGIAAVAARAGERLRTTAR